MQTLGYGDRLCALLLLLFCGVCVCVRCSAYFVQRRSPTHHSLLPCLSLCERPQKNSFVRRLEYIGFRLSFFFLVRFVCFFTSFHFISFSRRSPLVVVGFQLQIIFYVERTNERIPKRMNVLSAATPKKY